MTTRQGRGDGLPASLLAGRLTRLGPTPRAIVALIADGIDAPTALAGRIGKSPVTVYQHLMMLRAVGLIQTLRTGRTISGRLSPSIDAAWVRLHLLGTAEQKRIR